MFYDNPEPFSPLHPYKHFNFTFSARVPLNFSRKKNERENLKQFSISPGRESWVGEKRGKKTEEKNVYRKTEMFAACKHVLSLNAFWFLILLVVEIFTLLLLNKNRFWNKKENNLILLEKKLTLDFLKFTLSFYIESI